MEIIDIVNSWNRGRSSEDAIDKINPDILYDYYSIIFRVSFIEMLAPSTVKSCLGGSCGHY